MFGFFKSLGGAGNFNMADAIAQVGRGDAILIDVREEAEVRASGKAKGALNLPLSQLHLTANPKSGHFSKHLAKAAGKPVYLYCASGARSGRAASILESLGFQQVVNLGGFGNWQAAGGPVAR